jgi:ankyrin repeat protein
MQSVPDCTLLFYLGYCHSGAAVKAKDMKDVKPLQYAGWNNSLDVACLLIEHGANT